MTIITYAGPNISPVFAAGVMNNAWDMASAISATADRKLTEAVTQAANTPTIVRPTDLDGVTAPVLPNLTFDRTAMDQAVNMALHAVDPTLLAKLASGFSDFITTYFPLGSELSSALNWLQTVFAGGTGLNPAIEAQLWQRDRDRIMQDAAKSESEAMTTWSARGYPLPPGALAFQVQQIRRDGHAQIADSSRATAIKSFDTEVENLRFAVSKTLEYRVAAIKAAGEYVTVLALGPKLAVELATSVVDAEAKVYGAMSEFYRAQVAGYEIPLRLDSAKAEITARTNEANQRAFLTTLDERVKTVTHAGTLAATQAAALFNGFHASVGVMGQESI